jgi:hypothetical protein
MSDSAVALSDPRVFPTLAAASPEAAAIYAAAEASLGAGTAAEAAPHDRVIEPVLARHLDRDGTTLASLCAGAPSVPVARHVWRLLERLARETAGDAVSPVVFAIPVVVIAGREAGNADDRLSGVVDPQVLHAILDEHRALGGNRTFALANALVGTETIDIERMPQIRAWQRLAEPPIGAPMIEPLPIAIGSGREAVSLRFLIGSAIAGAGNDFLAELSVGAWGMPLTKALGRMLARPRVSVLALPRAPQRPLAAVQHGRAAHREVSAQIFVSNALRRIRVEAGEPCAVVSAHRAADASGGAELRVSLSAPFGPVAAEGFRCPLHALDRAADVVAMLVALLRDCRVLDVRVVSGVHPDRDDATGVRLFFKPDTIPDAAVVH